MTEEAETSLVVLPEGDTMELFSRPGMADETLALIRKHVEAFDAPSAETAEGRAEIKRFAMKVVRSKTYLEGIGAACAKKAKELPKLIDANRKKLNDTLDAWRDEIKAPVTAWEEAEQKRIDSHTEPLTRLIGYSKLSADTIAGMQADGLQDVLDWVIGLDVGPVWEEFQEEAARAKEAAIAALTINLEARRKFEAEQEELATLRRQAAEREAKDRQEAAARAAAEAAREAVERAAAAEIERREAAAKAEREAIEARALAEREAAERRERELREQAEAAQRQAAETEARVKREAEEAKAAEDAEQRRREADKEHRRKINSEALKALLHHGGLTEGQAVNVITAIVRGDIPNVKIFY